MTWGQADTARFDALAEVHAAVVALLELDPDMWMMNAGHFTRTEACGIARLMVAAGRVRLAQDFLERWVDEEIKDGEATEDTYAVAGGVLYVMEEAS